MHFLTDTEVRRWCEGRAPLTQRGFPVGPSSEGRYARAPVAAGMGFCRQLEQAPQPREECLLWVTTSGVWRSSENLHLYYRLRQSYGDRRLLSEAPGHLFLDYESADLISFLQVGIQCGWDMHLIPAVGYARAFVSHDEYVDFASDASNPDILTDFAATVGGAQILIGEEST